ncbi:translocation/assembly module TamB domain-containing protein [Paramesorhizobium deserti]|uniref:translocation/assembly module TamB domain-containing protein n=1 Tax=Paramesorhizobium deserti TaxID=1494590 RepID=UPI0009EBC907
MTRLLAIIAFLLFAFPAFAQDNAEEEKSYFLSFVEDKLSAPNRQISISNIQGVLSSEASIGSITIADRQGVWLRITNARIVWSRTALLTGRLSIQTLAADRVDVIRKPLPDDSLPNPESSSFSLPELPLAVILDELNIAHLTFGQSVFGLASELSATGRLRLEDGSLDSAFQIQRLDGPGGQLQLTAAYANQTRNLNLDLKLSEPANGIVANLLKIEGRPPVDLAVTGSGPLDDLDLDLTLDAAGNRVLTGLLSLDRQNDGLGFRTDFRGPIAVLVPPVFRDFFGAQTTLAANGLVKDVGGVRVDNIDLTSAALNLTASAETGSDNFLNRLRIDARVADPSGKRVVLPVSGGQTTVDNAALQVAFGDRPTNDWTGSLDIVGLNTSNFASRAVSLKMGGVAENLALPATRHITFNVNGDVSGITSPREDIAEALGDRIALAIDGLWRAGTPIHLEKAEITGNGLTAGLKGDIADYAFNGDIAVKAESIAPFSSLAGRDLAGRLDLKANGTVRPLSGAFDLSLDGNATGMRTGTDIVDRIIAGETRISGGVARSEAGLTARNFRIGNPQSEITANGTFSSKSADFDFDVNLADLVLLSEKASGRLTVNGSAKGQDDVIALALKADVPQGTLVGRRLSDAAVNFNGALDKGNLSGQLQGLAFLNGERVDLSTLLAVVGGERRLSDLSFTAGGTRISGGVTQTAAGLYQGRLSLDATDVSTAAALLLMEASGTAKADISLEHADGRQNADVQASIRDLKTNGTSVGAADIAANLRDIFNVPSADGTVTGRNIAIAGQMLDSLEARATQTGSKTDFTANSVLKNGTTAAVQGSLEPQNGGYLLSLGSADLRQGGLAAHLVQPATINVQGSNISFGDILLDVGNGRVNLRGEIAEALNLSVGIRDLPLAIANTVRPDLGLGGTVNGTASITGTRDKPDVAFDLNARSVTAAQLRQAGIDALQLEARGTSTADRLNVDSRVTGSNGLDARVSGGVPLGQQGDLALDVNLARLPLAALNGVAKGQDLAGTVSGTARVTGPLRNPAAEFNVNGTGLAAKPLRDNGLAPLTLRAAGRYADNAVNLSSVNIDGPQGLTVSGSGHVPFSGSGLGVDVTGSVPLALANRFLADRGGQVSGTLSLTANVSGSFDRPAIRGMFSTSGARLIDPETNVQLQNINVTGSMDGQAVTIRSATAGLSTGGSISANGTISTDAAANFPADIRITFNRARYADGHLIVATVNGGLAITGPLLRDPLISGRIDVERAEISVPESLGGGAADIDVKHIHTPPAVERTLERARVETRGVPTPTARPSVVRLDVEVNAPNRIFVRGRGLDTELGGQVRLTGPVTNIRPVGAFDLRRGRLSILGQRITFDEGQVTLVGDLNPQLNFVARAERSDIVVLITVSGTVDDLDIVFSSQPELPQDEVLARLIFDRSISELSAFQIAQLAAAAAELAGGKNTSLLGALRSGTGLDDLDIVTDSKGNAGVRAGRYIRDNVYLGVEAGSGGNTKATINLDITKNLKAKGGLGTSDSSIGLFYEKDY